MYNVLNFWKKKKLKKYNKYEKKNLFINKRYFCNIKGFYYQLWNINNFLLDIIRNF